VALAGGVAAYGQVLNTWGAILNSPGLFAAYLPFLRKVNGPGELPDRIKELAAIRVGVLNHCRYTVSHRVASAAGKGLRATDIEDVAAGRYDRFDEREKVAFQLAEAVTLAPPATSREQSVTGVSEALLARAKELFSDRELVELFMSLSLWNALSRFHRVMDFNLDMPQPPAAIDALL
jgi:AhpD family alkylhydroperoxidase